MPTQVSYPGVYIEEVPSQVRTITGVATSITAFIGRALRGPTNDPTLVQNFSEYTRRFGGLSRESTMSYAVRHFFQAGGVDALIVRVVDATAAASTAALTAEGGGPTIDLEAANPGTWGDNLSVTVDYNTRPRPDGTPDPALFNLTVQEINDVGDVVAEEIFRNVSFEAASERYLNTVLEEESDLVRVTNTDYTSRPQDATTAFNIDGNDGGPIGDAEVATGATLEADREGIYALDAADLFNLLVIPPYSFDENDDVDPGAWEAARIYCQRRRAFLLIDPPGDWNDHTDAIADVDTLRGTYDDYSALYFPRVRMPDPLQENRLATFAPSGMLAGIYARTDAQRGVWKAPAGQEASLTGVRELSYKMTDGQNGQLNPLGINCLRTFPVTGRVVWGARTLDGADRLASQWKYVPVRRLALYIEESLYRGTQWVIFEPNDEPLWAQIRLNVGAFMHNLFRQGAFQGASPREAYFVKCDAETTTQNDIDRGIVNLLVGFAPLKPAEFLIIKISQIAGEIQT